jgi:hypothetical protein
VQSKIANPKFHILVLQAPKKVGED